MKANQTSFAGLAAKAAANARIFFFCGPDEAGAWAAADRIVSLLKDPGERVEMAGADLRRDPVKLDDEARSGSLFGDARHILVRAQGDDAHDAVNLLMQSEVEASPVLIVATGATDKSRTAKLLADRPDALVAMFYPPDLRAIVDAIRTAANGEGLQIDSALGGRIARSAGLDIRLARSEVAKLALYLDASPESPKEVTPRDLDAIGAPCEDDGMAALVDTVLGGNTPRLSAELRRFHEQAINPVALLLAFERRAAQLGGLAARIGPRGNVEAMLKAEQSARRVFWKDVPALKDQLSRWRGAKLERLVDRLATLHQNVLANSQDAGLLIGQAMAEIARAAARRA